MTALRPRVLFVLLGTVFVHETLMPSIHVAGVRPDVLLLLTIMASLVAGPEAGALLGFAAGLMADLTLQTPFGLTALVLTLVGYAIGNLQSTILRSSWWIPPATAVIGSAMGVALFVLLGALIGQTQLLRPDLAHVGLIAGLVSLTNGILAVPVAAVVRWSFRPGQLERAYSGR